MEAPLKLLLLEDDFADAELIQRMLLRSGMLFEAVVATDESEFLKALDSNTYHAVLADNALPQYNSMEALELIRASNPGVAFILVTGTVSEEFAVDIIKQGADDYILKTNLARLPAAIMNAIDRKRTQSEKALIEKEIEREKELSISIINSLPGIFYMCNAAGKFLRWNKNFERISGYRDAEIIKMTPEYFFTGNEKDFYAKFMRNSFSRGYGEGEVSFVTKDVKKIPYYFTSKAVSFHNTECLICVGIDISAGKEIERELILLNGELHRISAHLENIRENEQARIAREVHDQLGQQITGLKMDLSWLRDKVNLNTNPELLLSKIDEMGKMLDESIVTVRKIASDLRPSILDDFGLAEAIEWHSREFSNRSGITIHYQVPEDKLELASSVAISLYRMYQEMLTNVARHSKADIVKTTLTIHPHQLVLSVADNGCGFDSNRPITSLGLLGMKERAHMVGGELKIDSSPGEGTLVLVTVPLL